MHYSCRYYNPYLTSSFNPYLVSVFFLFQVREQKHLGDFLGDYNDEKDDQKYYRCVCTFTYDKYEMSSCIFLTYHDCHMEIT